MKITTFSLLGRLLLCGAAIFAQEPPAGEIFPAFRDRALVLNIVARVIDPDQTEVWTSTNSHVTLPGRPVTIKLVGTNLVVSVQFTPYLGRTGSNLLVAQGQIWIDVPEQGVQYQTTIQTIPIEFGELVYFLPLGDIEVDTGSRIEIQVEVKPYTADQPTGK